VNLNFRANLLGAIKGRSNLLAFSFIISLILIIYASSLSGEFVSDDIQAIRDNPLTHNLSNFLKTYPTSFNVRFYFEQFSQSSHVILWHFFKDDVFWHHLMNVFLHCINSVLVFILVLRLFDKKLLAFLSALFFCLHTINNQAVAWISARPYLFAAFFYFTTVIFYIRATEAKNFLKSISFYMISLICSLGSFFIQSATITLPLIIATYNIFFKSLNKKENKIRWMLTLPYFALFTFSSFTLLGAVQQRIESYSLVSAKYGINMWFSFERMIIIAKSILFYLKLFLYPVKLGFYYPNFFEYNPQLGKFDIWAICVIVIVGSLLIIAFICRRRCKEISFAIMWFFITLVPFTSIVYLHALVAERYAYIASIGFCLGLACILVSIGKVDRGLKKHLIFRRILSIVLSLLILFWYGYLDKQRNKTWSSELSLYQAEVKNFPESKFAHNNLVTLLKDPERAINEFKKAIELDPLYVEPRYNLANRYAKMDRLKEAEAEYRKVIKLAPDFVQPYNNLAMVYLAQSELQKAEAVMKKAQELNLRSSLYYSNLGLVYSRMNRNDLAIDEFRKALKLDPQNQDAKINLLRSLKKINRLHNN